MYQTRHDANTDSVLQVVLNIMAYVSSNCFTPALINSPMMLSIIDALLFCKVFTTVSASSSLIVPVSMSAIASGASSWVNGCGGSGSIVTA